MDEGGVPPAAGVAVGGGGGGKGQGWGVGEICDGEGAWTGTEGAVDGGAEGVEF